MIFFKKHLVIIFTLLFFILLGCKLQEPNQNHGIIFLENRANKLIVNKSNQNDVIRIIGFPQIKADDDDNKWIYLERILTKGKYHELGKHKLKKNNVLLLSFDKYGILNSKKFYTKDNINEIQFSKKSTVNDISRKSMIQSFLQSMKQKMYINKDGNDF